MTDTQSDQFVTQEVSDGVALLTLNRPDRHNAWTVAMETELFDLLARGAADPNVRVIVITGSGRSFCPGLDAEALSDVARGGAGTNPHLRTPITYPRTVPKPIIAAINGACAGLGLVFALQCDLRFASRTAKFTTSFVRRGIMAEHGIAWALPREIGTAAALDLLFSGRVVQDQEAVELGLVNRVFDPEDLLPATLDYARGLAANSSPLAMGTIKRQVYAGLESTHEDARTLALRHWLGHVRHHADFKEGMDSYLEKRAPRFAPWDPATPEEPDPLPTS